MIFNSSVVEVSIIPEMKIVTENDALVEVCVILSSDFQTEVVFTVNLTLEDETAIGKNT